MFSSSSECGLFFARQLHKPGAGVYFASTRDRGRRGKNNNYFTTSRCLRGLCETIEEAAAAKDDNTDYPAKQAD